MMSCDWDDDSGYHDAVDRANRVTRVAWRVMGSLAGVAVLAAAATVVLVFGLLVALWVAIAA
ncbi:hypothetical protein [Streptomyces sp. NPDC087300]|uniref:hypothetical protein n=1 Tax=Streptomyces sp. NPDC087300 TaxID=3365780 RepID=UPI0038257333